MKPCPSVTMIWALFILAFVGTAFLRAPARAQVLPPIDPTGRFGEPPVLQEELLQPKPLPQLPLPVPPPARSDRLPPLRVFVKEIRIVGSTVFTVEDFRELASPYLNREISTEDLEAIRLAITVLYVNKGYATSGALIPDQEVKDGILTLMVIEGVLKEIQIEGNDWFRTGYLRDRILLGVGTPVNVNVLQERLQILQEDNRIKRLNAELKPGIAVGESALNVRVTEASPWKASLDANNHQSPVVGAERILATIMHQNLTGHGDIASFMYGRSQGVDPIIDAKYSLPLTARDTLLTFEYRQNNFLVTEAPFNSLAILSKSDIYGVTLRQPLYKTAKQEFALAVTGENLINRTSLMGLPFSFVPGAQNGKSVVTAIRFAQEWVQKTSDQVIAVFSRFSFGVHMFGATVNSDPNLTDGRFFSWLGEAQWIQRLEPSRIQLLARTNIQLANDALFPLEQIALGGRYSVRGYRENTTVRDNAAIGSFEARIPIYRTNAGNDVLHIAPFVDAGRSWNTVYQTPEPKVLASVGLGILATVPNWGRGELYWGQQLNHVSTTGGNLQNYGIHFQVVVDVL